MVYLMAADCGCQCTNNLRTLCVYYASITNFLSFNAPTNNLGTVCEYKCNGYSAPNENLVSISTNKQIFTSHLFLTGIMLLNTCYRSNKKNYVLPLTDLRRKHMDQVVETEPHLHRGILVQKNTSSHFTSMFTK